MRRLDLIALSLVAVATASAALGASRAGAQATPGPAGEGSTTAAVLEREGGHARTGFDDIETLDVAALPFTEIVRPSRFVPGSFSFGNTSDGALFNSALLPTESEAHAILAEHRERPSHYGTEELVNLLLDAAQRAHTADPALRLYVGNLSLVDGGDSPWSRSHNNGRDADLAFQYVDAAGNPWEPPTLAYVDRRGNARDYEGVRFDPVRTWTVVEALITSDQAQLQWLFIYDPLRTMLLDHARAIGADPDVIARAEVLLHQPSDSARHDDHLHVRIYCSLEDRLEGCLNWGPEWEHVDLFNAELAQRVAELARGLMTADDGIAIDCARFLRRLMPRAQAPQIAAALPYASAAVQLELLGLIGDLGNAAAWPTLVPLAESGSDPAVRTAAFETLRRLAAADANAALLDVAVRDRAALPDGRSAREAAIDAMAMTARATDLAALVALVGDERVEVRAAADSALRRLTLGAPGPGATHPLTLEAAPAHWKAFLADHGSEGRDAWIGRRFAREGYALGDFRQEPPYDVLIEALSDRDEHVRFVADRLLVELSGRWSPLEGMSTRERTAMWREALDR